jgi:hypothetical protein
MAWKMAPYQSTEEGAWPSAQGPSLFFSGPMYETYGVCTQLVSSNTETSLLLGSPLITDMSGGMFGGPRASRILPVGSLTLGSHFHGDFYGICSTNGTPNLRMRLGIVGGSVAATTFNQLCDNAALALVAAAAGSYFHVWFHSVVTAVGPGITGSISSLIGYEQGTTAAGSATRNVVPASLSLATFDLNWEYTWDIRATFSAADAANIIQLQFGQIWMMG